MAGARLMRWRQMQHMDAYEDSQRLYHPISAIDIVCGLPLYRFDFVVSRRTLDRALTAHAKRTQALARPWKIAR